MGGRGANTIGSPTGNGGGGGGGYSANFFMGRRGTKSHKMKSAGGGGRCDGGHHGDKYKRVMPSLRDGEGVGGDYKSRNPLLYIQDHPAVRPDLCRVIVCTTLLLASTALWWLANCCGPLFLYLAAAWTCLFFVLLVTSLIGFGLKVRAEEVKGSRRDKCERSDTSDASRSLRFKDLLMLRSFRVIKYRECEEALEVAQAVSTLSSRALQRQPTSIAPPQHHHPNCPHHQPPPKQHRHLHFADEDASHTAPRHHHHHHHKSPLLSGGRHHHHHHHHHPNNVTGGDVIKQQHLKRQHTSPPLGGAGGEESFAIGGGSRDFLAL